MHSVEQTVYLEKSSSVLPMMALIVADAVMHLPVSRYRHAAKLTRIFLAQVCTGQTFTEKRTGRCIVAHLLLGLQEVLGSAGSLYCIVDLKALASMVAK